MVDVGCERQKGRKGLNVMKPEYLEEQYRKALEEYRIAQAIFAEATGNQVDAAVWRFSTARISLDHAIYDLHSVKGVHIDAYA